MSRLSAIFDDANDDGDIDAAEDVYASYKYLGAGRIVVEDYEEAEVSRQQGPLQQKQNVFA